MRAEKRFVQLSMVNLMIASFTAVFGIISAYYYGIIGFLIVMFVVNGLALAATLSRWPQKRPSVSKLGHQAAQFSTLVKAGFPIMFSRFLLAVFYNIDLLVIWLVFTKSDLGIYSVAKYVTTAIMLIPAAVSSVLYPKIMETYGAFGKTKELRKYLIQPTFFLGATACFLCGILFLSLHLPINWLLSDYVLSIIPGKILLLACFFGVISYMPTIILISVKKEYLLMQVTMAVK
jgi:O-antigen/teichoic acid export membrane protein